VEGEVSRGGGDEVVVGGGEAINAGKPKTLSLS
jgi:hypothetical protein